MKNKSISGTIPILILFLIPLIIYSISLTFGFVFDDNPQILENPWITDLSHIPDIFSTSATAFMGRTSNTYRPLVFIAFIVEHYVFGFKAWGFHLVNVLLHSLNTVMVFLVASFLFSKDAVRAKVSSEPSLKTSPIPAFLAALVFALHTINTESVAWISAIPELIFTLLLLVSFYIYIKAEDGGRRAIPISVLAFFLALLTKETAMALVLLIPAYEFSNHGRSLLKRWRAYLPYPVTAAVYMAIRTSVMGGGVHNKFVDLNTWESLINIFPLIARYFAKLILPLGLSALYPIPPVRSIAEPVAVIGIIAALLFLSALIFFRKNRTVFFSLLWIFIPLMPVMYIPAIPISSMADRYLYLSTIGFAILAAYLARHVFGWAKPGGYGRSVVVALAAVLLVLYSAATVTRSLVWKDSLTLWSDAAGKFPESPHVHLRLAVRLQEAERIDSAITHYREVIRYREALKFDTYKDTADYNLAVIYQERGEHANAIIHYKEVIRLGTNKNTAAAHYNLAVLYQKRGDYAGALSHYGEAISLAPDKETAATAHYNLALLYQERGEHANAIIHYREVVGMDPDNLASHYRLAVLYQQGDDTAGAIASYREVLRIKPDYEDAHYDLAWIYQFIGDNKNAIAHYKAVIRLSPGSKDAHYNMALIYAGDGLLDDAAKEFRAVLEIDPSYGEAKAQLDRVMRLGGSDE